MSTPISETVNISKEISRFPTVQHRANRRLRGFSTSRQVFGLFDIDFPSAGRFNMKVAFRILATVGCTFWNCQHLPRNINSSLTFPTFQHCENRQLRGKRRSLQVFRVWDIDSDSAGRFNMKVAFRICATVGCTFWNCQQLRRNIKIFHAFDKSTCRKPTVARIRKVPSTFATNQHRLSFGKQV